MFEIQPARLNDPSLLNLNVRQPLNALEVNGPGIVFPQKDPGKPPGTKPPLFVLEICGAVILFPL